MKNELILELGFACKIFLAALDYFEVRNKNRKKQIVMWIFSVETRGSSVWDENLEDELDLLNRYEPFLAWLPEGKEKEHFKNRLLALDLSHKIVEHGRNDLKARRDGLVEIIRSEEHLFPGLAALLSIESILSGMWD